MKVLVSLAACVLALVTPTDAAAKPHVPDEGRKAALSLWLAFDGALQSFEANNWRYVDDRFDYRDLARAISHYRPRVGRVGVVKRVRDLPRARRVFVVKRGTSKDRLRLAYKRAGGRTWVLAYNRKRGLPTVYRLR